MKIFLIFTEIMFNGEVIDDDPDAEQEADAEQEPADEEVEGDDEAEEEAGNADREES